MWRRRSKTADDGNPRLNRRELLQGKLWKLIRPTNLKPLVMRYPKNRDDIEPRHATEEPKQPPRSSTLRSIGGIVIQPVTATPYAAPPRHRTIPVFRPPGAIEESQFLAGCTRCSDCADACPYNAIGQAPERFGAIAGTPMIQADTAACMMCKDFPCITACKPGVLVNALPKVMGTAKVTAQLCLAHHGTTCSVCSERCPVAGAIAVADGKPTVREDACTGCGVCRYVCPAPENAILLMPTFNRPPLPIQ